jgi:hypothetical protein
MIGGQVFAEHTNIIAIRWRSFRRLNNCLIILSLDLAYITQWLTPTLADLSLAAPTAVALGNLYGIVITIVVITGDIAYEHGEHSFACCK